MTEILSFAPILKSTLWGGERLVPFMHLDAGPSRVGEAWAISGLPGHETRVDRGAHRGCTIGQLVGQYGPELVGEHVYREFGDTFPLLIKLIDAAQDLSIQVHPDDLTARRLGHPRGKTEMWYVMDASTDASVLLGLRQPLTPDDYRSRVEDHSIADALCHYPVRAGDCLHIPAGRIHAIGHGTLLAEIQQTSDVTYRIYDYDRRDATGHRRTLHTAEAAQAIDYSVQPDYRTHYTLPDSTAQAGGGTDSAATLVRCPYFTTRLHRITGSVTLTNAGLDSFVVLIGVEGKGRVTDHTDTDADAEDGDNSRSLGPGQALLLPATIGQVTVEGDVYFLETYIENLSANETLS